MSENKKAAACAKCAAPKDKDDEKKERIINIIRVCVSVVLLALAKFLPGGDTAKFVIISLYIASYLISGGDVLYKAVRNIFRAKLFDESFLMAVATVGALCIGEYTEACFVMILYQIGEMFEDYAEERSRRSIADLMSIRPDHANIERDGKLVQVDPSDVKVGDIITVKTGEKIPLDGIVRSGSATLDTGALTGESVPRGVGEGDTVLSGCVNTNGLIRVEVTKTFGESTVSKILDLLANSADKKSKSENFITRFSRVYTPSVVGAAVLIAVLPPLLGAGEWSYWIHRALVLLVISCPCALVISVPLTFFGGLGRASRQGILIKGSNYMERLSHVDTVVFDKTGTLTKGVFKVTAVHPEQCPEKELLRLAATAELYSDHPISQSLKAAWAHEISDKCVSMVNETAGLGVSAVIDGRRVWVGNGKLMDSVGAAWHQCHNTGTVVHVAQAGEKETDAVVYLGHIVISDEVKETSAEAVADLHRLGISKTVMLTGDRKETAEAVASQLGIDEVRSQLLPDGKVSAVEELLGKENGRGSLAFVGDGINDAPVLMRADIGVAMGALGSEAAIEAADVVLMNDDPACLPKAVETARYTKKIVTENIIFILTVKAVILTLGALGMAGMMAAVFADVGVLILATLNSIRALVKKDK